MDAGGAGDGRQPDTASGRGAAEERRGALRQLLPAVERLRGLREDGQVRGAWASHRTLLRYPGVEDDARAVMAAFDGGVLTRRDHLEELARRGLSHGGLTDLAGLAETADEELTRALITWVVRSERFEGGVVAEALREGTLVTLLDRLRELYDL
ncbi:DUF6508 domain-containing protein [Dietzia sp. CH92]|uniref:DUF6508 domain-containing protein n=1 Tax=Dietzia sp. CH92 TaxID=3051823 RepID=UPI0028D030B6|nr:DUF6508 domain-containing protein [Dietzia sp. CH92]